MNDSEVSPLNSKVAGQFEDFPYKPFQDDSGNKTEAEEEDSKRKPVQKEEPLLSFGESCDLIVKLENKTSKAQYLVSSSVLQLVSKVWARSINHKRFAALQKEKVGDQEYPTLKLEDDDVECLSFLFMILHFQYNEVPRKLTYTQLRSMTLICDKYNCWSGLHLWKDNWFGALISIADLPGYEDWLFISDRGDFTHQNIDELKRSLVYEAGTLSPCKSYFYRYRKKTFGEGHYKVHCELLPQKILEVIMNKRKQAILDMIECLRKFTGLVSGISYEYSDVKEATCKNITCQNIALGSFYNSLKKANLWPLVYASSDANIEWHGSLNELVERIRSLKMTTVTNQEQRIGNNAIRLTSSVSIVSKNPPSETPQPTFVVPRTPSPNPTVGSLFRTATVSSTQSSNTSGGNLFGPPVSVFGGSPQSSSNINNAPAFGSTSTSSMFRTSESASNLTSGSLFGTSTSGSIFGVPSGGSIFEGNKQSSNAPRFTFSAEKQPSLLPRFKDARNTSFRNTHQEVIQRLSPEHEGQCYIYSMYDAPAYRTIFYDPARKPCELAFQFGTFRIYIENIYTSAY
ncbi:hypothetical protein TWF694_006552 [Orbilia ellipsospora]|uniref:BTB domain-containing protein n=1 Tax=Orbilia ellipsospora TaxID=2528407 RepID=A0AAV9XKU0_9PEZI